MDSLPLGGPSLQPTVAYWRKLLVVRLNVPYQPASALTHCSSLRTSFSLLSLSPIFQTSGIPSLGAVCSAHDIEAGAGLIQMQLAERSGVAQSTTVQIEDGACPNPHSRTLTKLA
jgi:hypothetical protein